VNRLACGDLRSASFEVACQVAARAPESQRAEPTASQISALTELVADVMRRRPPRE